MSPPSEAALQRVRELLHAADDQTRAGNYFISNYPPFSFWQPDLVAPVEAVLDSPAPGGVPLGLYFHIPFCRQRCHFCYFRVYTDRNAAQIEAYLSAALAELQHLAARPRLRWRKPDFVYFGGGTPSYLSARQLEHLAGRMRALLPWDAADEIAFECEPGTLTRDKLEALRGLGITRLSLGVEHFDDHILEINGRAHRSKEVGRAYGWAREMGFAQINIDLIAGMVEETDAKWADCVRRAVELAPDSVTIYQMEVPHNTTIYREMRDSGRLQAPVATWPVKRRWAAEAFAAFEAAGYTLTSAYTAVRDPARSRFLYRDLLWRGADLLGLGVASFSHLGGVHYQNHTELEPYQEAVAAGRLPVRRALPITAEERLLRELILQFKLGAVQRHYFQEKFGIDIAARFADELGALLHLGLVEETEAGYGVTREALMKIDALLHVFFLPQHQTDRMV